MASSSSPVLSRPTMYTDCARCLTRINNSGPEKKKHLITELLFKQVLKSDIIESTDVITLKDLAIVAVDQDSSPPEGQFALNCYLNIKRIYEKIKINHSEFPPEQLHIIRDYLLVNNEIESRFTIVEEPLLKRVNCLEATDLLRLNPIQWTLRTLDPSILAFGYKAFMTTESLLENIELALKEPSFSPKERKSLQLRLIFLLMTWLKERYFIKELYQDEVKTSFQNILNILSQETDPSVKKETESFNIHLQASCTITPRSSRSSSSLDQIEVLLVNTIHQKTDDAFAEKCCELTAEITCYFVYLMTEVPFEEYFRPLDTLAHSPHLAQLTKATNALESWFYNRFCELDRRSLRRNFRKAMARCMHIAYTKYEYQTAFSLKIVLDRITKERDLKKLPKDLFTAYNTINDIFNPCDNLKNLVYTYGKAAEETKMFMPVFGFINKLLHPVMVLNKPTEIRTVMVLNKLRTEPEPISFEIYNNLVFELIFKTLHPFYEFIKMAENYNPKTNLRQKIEVEVKRIEAEAKAKAAAKAKELSEHAQAGSSSLDALTLPV
jgi:hypothetical protein